MSLESKFVTYGDNNARVIKALAQAIQDQGGNPDHWFQWVLGDTKARTTIGKATIDSWLVDCTQVLEMAPDPERQFFQYGEFGKNLGREGDAFREMLTAHFKMSDDFHLYLPHRSNASGNTFDRCHRPGKIPKKGRQMVVLELTTNIVVEELLNILQHRRLGLGWMYDLVRVRNYHDYKPLIALGSNGRCLMGSDPISSPCVCGEMKMEVRRREYRDSLKAGCRLLLWQTL